MRLFRHLFTPSGPMSDLAHQTGEVQTPFQIRPVSSSKELRDVATMRRDGYRLADNSLSAIEDTDFASHVSVLGAFENQTNRLLGTMRILLTRRGPSEVKQYVDIPQSMRDHCFVEARHLCVPKSEHGLMVKILLCKSLYLLAIHHQCPHTVIATRSALQGFYRLLHFVDISAPTVEFTPPGSSVRHSVLSLPLDNLEQQWRRDPANETLCRIFFEQTHPGLLLPQADDVLNPLSIGGVELEFEREGLAAGTN